MATQDLFSSRPAPPLPEMLRPTSINDIVGQEHLLGPGKPLRLAFESGKLHSFILWGPPGVGKTSLARLAADAMDCEFIAISGAFASIKDIRDAVARAQDVLDHRGKKSVLFVDEIHRFNKGQQDGLLPFVESGLVTLLGATTENPSFELNAALLSRAQVYVMKPLEDRHLLQMFKRVAPSMNGVTFEDAAVTMMVQGADGDGRRFLAEAERMRDAAQAARVNTVTPDFVRNTAGAGAKRFDKHGDNFFDSLSALQKSIRGSQPNAALYWMARAISAGVDPLVLARRLVVMATEEVGNADPRALQVATAACAAFERVGAPEGLPAIAQAAVYIATAPKSNAAYSAWYAALAFVESDRRREVPMHLRNAPTQLMKDLGYKKGYRYAHSEPEAYAAGEHYFPSDLAPQEFYVPNPRGEEVAIAERMAHWRALDDAAREPGAEN